MDVLATLPGDCRFGVGVINQKAQRVDPVDAVVARARQAIDLFGAERVLLNPDCGGRRPSDRAHLTRRRMAAGLPAGCRHLSAVEPEAFVSRPVPHPGYQKTWPPRKPIKKMT